MITDAIINLFIGIALGILSLIPSFVLTGIDKVLSWLNSIIHVVLQFFGCVGYFLPMEVVIILISLTISIFTTTLMWSISKFMLSYLIKGDS